MATFSFTARIHTFFGIKKRERRGEIQWILRLIFTFESFSFLLLQSSFYPSKIALLGIYYNFIAVSIAPF